MTALELATAYNAGALVGEASRFIADAAIAHALETGQVVLPKQEEKKTERNVIRVGIPKIPELPRAYINLFYK